MSELDRRQVLTLFGALGVAGVTAPLLSSCGAGPATPASSMPVRIGLIVPRAGANKAIGDDLTAGFQLYLTLHGNRLGDHPVQVITMEEGDSADSGRAAVDKLVKEYAVQAMTGVASSKVMSGIRDQVEAAQVPLLGSNASPTSLGSVKYIWRTSYVNNEAGRALGGYLAVQRGMSTYVISDDVPTSREEVSGFVSTYNGVTNHPSLTDDPVQIPLTANPGMPLTGYLNAIRASGARAVFASFAPENALAFLKAYRAAGLTASLYAPGFLSEGAGVLRGLGDAAGGLYTAMNYAPDLDNGANRTFAAEYQKLYNTPPSTYAMASYDAAAVLDKALQLAGGDLAPQSVNTALSQIGQIDSPRGGWQFNQSRTPLQRWYLRQVRKTGQVFTNILLSDLAMLG